MFNDPLGDKWGDYYQDPTGSGASGINAVPFHGGYQRISHASGNSWSNALDAPPLEPFSEFWGDFLTSAVDGRHSGSFSGGAISSIYDIWSGLVNGEGFGIDYRDDGSVGVQTNRYTASLDGSGYSNITIAGANHIVDQHTKELSVYGHIVTAYNISFGASVGPLGGIIETGIILTDKGWARKYKTIYFSPGFASPSAALGFSVVSPVSDKYLPTFSDWKGAMVGFSGSLDFVSGNIGFTSTYMVWGLGVSAAPESLSYPFMKDTRGSGSMNVGVTSWIGSPYRVGNLNLPGASQRYINTQKYHGGQ